jgi:peptidylprolyl isomerase
MKTIFTLIISTFILTGSFYCQKKNKVQTPQNPISKAELTKILMDIRKLTPQPAESDETAVIETNMGTIKFKFYPDVAPIHCASFKMLANSGFYNGTIFHRVVPNFMIQGGDILSRDDDPNNDGTGNPGYFINAEFSGKNHKRGIVSAARRGDNINSAGSQFFICVADAPYLDGQYSIFGEVIEGMDVADKIVNAPTNPDNNKPIKEIMMKNVKVIKGK